MRVNFVGSGSLLLCCLREMRERGEGTLVVLSTVGGRAAPGLERDLRSGEGGARCARPGPRRRDCVERRARARRPSGVREDADDRRPIAGPVRDHARDRGGSDRRSARRARPHDLGAGSVAPDLHGPAPPTKSDLSEASAVTRNALRHRSRPRSSRGHRGADPDARRGDRGDDRDSRAVRVHGQFHARLAPEIVESGAAADDQRACARAPETGGTSVRRDCSPCRLWPI